MWRPYSPIVSDLPCHSVLSMFVGDVGWRGATSSHVKNLTAQTWRSTCGWSFSSKCGFDRLALLVHRSAVYRSTGVCVCVQLAELIGGFQSSQPSSWPSVSRTCLPVDGECARIAESSQSVCRFIGVDTVNLFSAVNEIMQLCYWMNIIQNYRYLEWFGDLEVFHLISLSGRSLKFEHECV